MKKIFLLRMFKSYYCIFVFLISLVGVYFLVPSKIFYGYYTWFGIAFILISALTLTCLVRIIKERVISAKSSGASFLGLLSIIFGFGALQACTIGAPICGATIGGGIISLIFPGFVFGFMEKYSIWIVIISIVIQIFAIYFMNCFKLEHKIVSKKKKKKDIVK